jgi:hypothetical protein
MKKYLSIKKKKTLNLNTFLILCKEIMLPQTYNPTYIHTYIHIYTQIKSKY